MENDERRLVSSLLGPRNIYDGRYDRVRYAIDAPREQRIRLESSVFHSAIETLYHLVIGHKLARARVNL